MGRKKNIISSMEVAEKMKDPLAKRLNDIIVEPKQLADYLGISAQAVNQWRLGLSRPSLDNLVKIADFYNVSTDYILNRTDVKRTDADLQAICDKTGLSEEAAGFLIMERKCRDKVNLAFFVNTLMKTETSYRLFSRICRLSSLTATAEKQKQAMEKAAEEDKPLNEILEPTDFNDHLRRRKNISLADFHLYLEQFYDAIDLCRYQVERDFREIIEYNFPKVNFEKAFSLLDKTEEEPED